MAELDQSPQPRRNGKSAAAFRTISEVAVDLEVPPHVLRFWESKFSQVRPLKRGGGRRYYRPEDVALLERIRELLYREGYTIKGVQKLLRDGAVRMPTAGEAARAAHATSPRKGGNPESAARQEAAAAAASTSPAGGTTDAAASGEASNDTAPMAPTGTAPMAPTGPSTMGEAARENEVSRAAVSYGAETAIDAGARSQLTAVLDDLKALKKILADARR
jgi:DNA-binding transcriptional MerR regulator